MTPQQEELRRRGICVVIPTYNNAGTIVDVVSRTLEQCADVFVVCDGCTDGTDNLLKPFADRITLVQLSGNRGKGIALRKGIHAAANHGFAYAITLDADGQHYPEDIPCLLEANRLHPDAPQILLVTLLAASSCTASTIPQLAGVYGEEGAYASALSIVNLVFCIVTMPLIVFVYQFLL